MNTPDYAEKENTPAEATAGSLKSLKKQLRRDVKAQISALSPAYTEAADKKIIELIESLPEYQAAHTIFCFVGSDTEINTRPLLQDILESGRTLAVPLCITNRIMQARRIESLGELTTGYYGLLEPAADSPLVQPGDLDLAIIPCVSCSHDGTRLGHGGGFYDIYFSHNRGIRTAMICREAMIRENIPKEDHDLIFPLVITEKGIFRNGSL